MTQPSPPMNMRCIRLARRRHISACSGLSAVRADSANFWQRSISSWTLARAPARASGSRSYGLNCGDWSAIRGSPRSVDGRRAGFRSGRGWCRGRVVRARASTGAWRGRDGAASAVSGRGPDRTSRRIPAAGTPGWSGAGGRTGSWFAAPSRHRLAAEFEEHRGVAQVGLSGLGERAGAGEVLAAQQVQVSEDAAPVEDLPADAVGLFVPAAFGADAEPFAVVGDDGAAGVVHLGVDGGRNGEGVSEAGGPADDDRAVRVGGGAGQR